MQNISVKECHDELDLLFKKYALLTAKLRQIQTEYRSLENQQEKRSR